MSFCSFRIMNSAETQSMANSYYLANLRLLISLLNFYFNFGVMLTKFSV